MSRFWKTAGMGSELRVGVFCVGLWLTCAGKALAQPIVYVDADASGANDGSSWTDAYDDLQAALDAAEASGGLIREIWVAYGTYKPSKRTDPDDPRSATFQLIDGVALYGGFAGTEASVDERIIDANPTILSGDFNGDDQPDFANYGENAYHVVTGIRVGSTTIIDGCTVTSGHAPGPGFLGGYGGGIHLENSYPEIRNCTFTRNLAERPGANVAWSGGGGAALFLYQEGMYPGPPPLTVSRSRFTDNSSAGDGGAVFIYGAGLAGSVVFSECSFERNVGLGAFSASEGSAHTFRACTFSDNSSNGSGGAISTYYSSGALLIEQCRFERNIARAGGAVSWDGGPPAAIHGSVFVDNSAESGNAGALLIYWAETVELSDTEFWGNSADYAGGVELDWNGLTIVRRCQFGDNSANKGEGGGLYLYGWGSAQVTDSNFEYNRAESGGGLYVEGAAKVSDCTFHRNWAARLGGGLFVNYGAVELMGCRFGLNSASEGGGVSGSWGSLKAVECAFVSNDAAAGGAVANNYETDILMDRCKVTKNSAQVGGGLSSTGAGATATLNSCLFADNLSTGFGGGIAGGAGPLNVMNCSIAGNTAGALGAGMIVGHDTTVTNSIVWGNVVDPEGGAWTDETAQIEGLEFAAIDYSDVQGWSGAYGGDGNVGLDPLFVAPTDPEHPSETDFNLRPESPCINAGLTEIIDWGPWDPPPSLDLDGRPRVLCELVDMGAYEFGVAGDVDCDGDVDLNDLSEWSACMGGPGVIPPSPDCSAFDFDGDADIDLVDFAQFSRVFSPGSR